MCFMYLTLSIMYILLFFLSLINFEQMENDCVNRPRRRTYRITSIFLESDSSGWDWSRLLTKQWEWSRTNVGWLSVECWSNRDRAQPTCGHGTCGCTFWLMFCCFTCTVPSEFAWLLCATALSVPYNQCTENV